jgi:hypothetical protein
MFQVSHDIISVQNRRVVLTMYCEAPIIRVCHQPARMLRCVKMRGGARAVSGSSIWMATKVTVKTPMTVRSTITRPLLHCKPLTHGHGNGRIRKWLTANLCPPHCRARTKQTMAGTRHIVPGMSSCSSFFVRGSFSASRWGVLMNKQIATTATAPIGRLM